MVAEQGTTRTTSHTFGQYEVYRRCFLDSSCAYAQAEATARPPRFYVPAPLPAAGQVVRLGADEARHATRALRLREVVILLRVPAGAGQLDTAEQQQTMREACPSIGPVQSNSAGQQALTIVTTKK